jgi:hypothetical protein
MGYQFDKTYMDGGGAFNNEAEANVKLEFSAARVMRFKTNVASSRRLGWPVYDAVRPYVGNATTPYMDNFKLSSDSGTCALRAAMCCFVADRLDSVVQANSVACHHDIGDSRRSSNLYKGWGVYDSNMTSYCTAFAWGAEGTTSEQYKGNGLFDIAFGNLLKEGFVKNIAGAPMCGCVEKMPVVANSDCRDITVANEQYSLTITSSGTLSIVQVNTEISYKNCDEGSFLNHYATIASADELAKMNTRIVGDCNSSNTAYLNDRFLIAGSPGNQFVYPSANIWQQVAGIGLSYYPVPTLDLGTRDIDFRNLVDASPNKIIYRHCESCNTQHQRVFYRRLTPIPPTTSLNFLDLFLNNWMSKNNTLGVDFNLYSTYEDAVAQTNKWLYCNYDDPGVGFPRDCGRTGYSPCQWNSLTKGWLCGGEYAATSFGFYVEKAVV